MEIKKIIRFTTAIILIAFGLVTLFLSSSIILDLFGVRAEEGNYVSFVVWANFFCSLIYIAAAYGLIKTQKWSTKILSITIVLLASVFVGLLIHIKSGGVYENKTIGALLFRISLTSIFTAIAYFSITKKQI